MRAPRVDIHFQRGRVEVSGGLSDEIDVAEIEGLEVRGDGERVRIDGQVGECVIYAPEETELDVHGQSAEISVLGIASVKIHLHEGDIDLADITGRVDVHVHAAEISVDNVNGPIDIVAHRGDIDIRVPPGVGVDADVRSERGDVVNTAVRGHDVRVKARLHHGDITVGAAD